MKNFYRIFPFVLFLFFSNAIQAQITRDQCYLCHSNSSLQKTITLTSGSTEVIPLYVDSTQYNLGLHHALECVACHTDINSGNLYSHSLNKTYGGWARFSAKNDTVTAGSERTRNYYTTAAMNACVGCHTQKAGFVTSAHHTIWRQKQSHLHTVNGESVGEAFVGNDCNRCHSSCGTCHFQSLKKQYLVGDVLTIWDSLQTFGDGSEPLKTESNNLTQFAMDWTTNIASHTFNTKANLEADNTVCQSCHLGYYKPPMSGFLSEDPPYPKTKGTNIRRHPQQQEGQLGIAHKSLTCAQCHTDVHAYPDGDFDWQINGDAKCVSCHPTQTTNHYPTHTTVDCISCHFSGFAREKGQGTDVHDTWRWNKNNRVRPLVVKYNEAISWYPHNIVKPDPVTSCAAKCHYEGNLVGAAVIPVELISFTAQSENQKVILRWMTATELNNNGFEIQRKAKESEFVTIGFVRGKGTTTNQHEYSYVDKGLADAKYFYRLKQVDFDGSYEYSSVIEVDVRSLDEYVLEQNYPNPFNPTTTIGYILKEKSNAKLTLLNGIGEEIAVIVNEEQDKGYHKVDFNSAKLPSGIYFYKLKAGAYTSVKKMILLR